MDDSLTKRLWIKEKFCSFGSQTISWHYKSLGTGNINPSIRDRKPKAEGSRTEG